MALIRTFSNKTNNQRWWFIRHAPVIGYKNKIYGCSDVDCDTSMSDIFLRLAEILPIPDKIYTSDLLRTYKTAFEISKQAEIIGKIFPNPIKHHKLREQNFGQWEGKQFSDIYLPDTNKNPIAGFSEITSRIKPQDGESFIDVMFRTSNKFDDIIKKNQSVQNILFVVHAGTIRSALTSLLKIDPEICQSILIDNLSLSVFEKINLSFGCHWKNLCVNFTA